MSVPVLTIDGPSGSGKGTISRAVARALGWHFLDSGALYRAVGLAAIYAGIATEDSAALAQLARKVEIRFEDRGDAEPLIWLGAREVSAEIRSEQAASAASKVAAVPEVRAALLQKQRDFERPPGLVADGRDMGTELFPHAGAKVFLTASAEERALRRCKQLSEKGLQANMLALLREIEERDRRDMQRPVAPLVAAADAVVLDSTGMSIHEVVTRVLHHARERFSLSA